MATTAAPTPAATTGRGAAGGLSGHGQALREARYEAVTLDTCAGTVTIRAHYGRHPQTRKWQQPIRRLWGLGPRQRLSPQLQERVSCTAAETDPYERAARMGTKWGTPLVASTIHKHVQQTGREAATQAQGRHEQLMHAATQATNAVECPSMVRFKTVFGGEKSPLTFPVLSNISIPVQQP